VSVSGRPSGGGINRGGPRVADVCDLLDRMGHEPQVLHTRVRPISGRSLVGPAYTIEMRPGGEINEEFYEAGLAALAPIPAMSVVVIATHEAMISSCWGGNLSAGARACGAVGAVTDGLVRDADEIDVGFAAFAAGTSPLCSRGRLIISGTLLPVRCGGVHVAPGDTVIGDRDGVVSIPSGVWQDLLDAGSRPT
jgi:4-hydroxy-4-methyl-2-oxoglutarate aldolase